MKYDTTKKQCQKKINDSGNPLCSRCGLPIVPLKTVNNSGTPTYWSGCMHGQTEKDAWGHFDCGVSKEVFELARKMVCDDRYSWNYSGNIKDWNYYLMESIRNCCEMITSIEYIKHNEPRYTLEQLETNYKKYNPPTGA